MSVRPLIKRVKSTPVGVHDNRLDVAGAGVRPRRPASYNRRLDPTKREIRLLSLSPRNAHDRRPEGKLETASLLAEDIEFIALSYVWGDAGITSEVLVDGVVMDVTVNLAAALWYFKEFDMLRGIPDGRPLRIWVDALCINQDDLVERAQQVTFMKDVYGRAKHVFTWFGPPDETGIDLALRIIDETVQTYKDMGGVDPQMGSTSDEDESEDDGEPDDDGESDTDGEPEDDGESENDEGSENDEESEQDEESNVVEECDEDEETNSESGSSSASQDSSKGVDTEQMETFVKALDSISSLHEDENCGGLLGNKAWEAIHELGSNVYWKRVWVYQEMVLAAQDQDCHQFLCGKTRIAMRDYTQFASLCKPFARNLSRPLKIAAPKNIDKALWEKLSDGLFFHVGNVMEEVGELQQLLPSDATNSLPSNVLDLSRKATATNPRDMVYGLAAVLRLPIQPDYTAPVRNVYLEWARLEHERLAHDTAALQQFMVEMLQHSYLGAEAWWLEGDEGVVGLPSWLPDLSMLYHTECPLPWEGAYRFSDPSDNDDEPASSTAPFLLSAEGVMSVQGAVCGVVSGYFECTPPYDDLMGRMKRFARAMRKVMALIINSTDALQQNYRTGCSLEQAMMFTMLWGINPYTTEILKPKDALNMWEYLNDLIDLVAEHGEIEALSLVSTPEIALALAWTMDNFGKYKIFWTDTGYIGIIPLSIQTGDYICVLDSCGFPVVMRKTDGGGWIHVGACYIYEISGNNPLEVIKRDGLEGQLFHIY